MEATSLVAGPSVLAEVKYGTRTEFDKDRGTAIA